jgi:hypothetical protein
MLLNNEEISAPKILKSLILKGNMGLILKELRRRLYSDDFFYINRRDLTLPFAERDTKLPLTLREIRQDDIPTLLNLDTPGLPCKEIMERICLLRMLKSGLRTCYVAVSFPYKKKEWEYSAEHYRTAILMSRISKER